MVVGRELELGRGGKKDGSSSLPSCPTWDAHLPLPTWWQFSESGTTRGARPQVHVQAGQTRTTLHALTRWGPKLLTLARSPASFSCCYPPMWPLSHAYFCTFITPTPTVATLTSLHQRCNSSKPGSWVELEGGVLPSDMLPMSIPPMVNDLLKNIGEFE
jgi:hypothetical protein